MIIFQEKNKFLIIEKKNLKYLFHIKITAYICH
jgi:hypothetical protein